MDVYNLDQIPTEAKIRKYLRGILFGKHIFCPVCRSGNVNRNHNRYWCSKCRKRFTLTSHTWLTHLRLSLPKFWLVLWCWVKQMPVKQTQELTKLSEKGVRHHFDLFRAHLPRNQELLEHIVQLDEAYFGGWGGWALLMGKEKGTRKIAYQVIPADSVNKTDALGFLKSYVKPNSHLNTDGSTIYQGINKYFPVTHSFEIHKSFEFKNTSEIEGMFGVVRTFVRRMHHHTSRQKFPEYMVEFYMRFSHPEMFRSPYQYLLNTLQLAPLR